MILRLADIAWLELSLESDVQPPCRTDASAARCTRRYAPTVATQRDLRLDLFRGLALWLIFLDHIPSNIVSWITIRNYGFSDATEIFIFISGYTAAFVYGRAMLRARLRDLVGARILRARLADLCRPHLPVRHLHGRDLLRRASFENPLYAEEMNILDFLKQPDVTIIQALLLKFKPVNMDVLPLYIVLLLMFPPILWLLLRSPTLALGAVGRRLCARLEVRLEPARLSGAAPGTSIRSPGNCCSCSAPGARSAAPNGSTGAAQFARHARARASPISLFAFYDRADLVLPGAEPRYVPHWLEDLIYPIDKTNLDVLRFAHFLALAAVTVWFIPRDWPPLKFARVLPGYPVRPAFAGNLLPRRVPGLRRPFRDGRDSGAHLDADRDQRLRHPDNDRSGRR